MKVALFTDTFMPDVNGVAKTLGRWVDFLKSRGTECRVFAPQSHSAAEADQRLVERFYSIPFLLYPECRMAIPNLVHLNHTLKAFAPDLIHVATPFNLGLIGLHYAKRHQLPVVASYHTHFDQYLTYYKLQWMEPMLWKYMQWFHHDCRKIYVPSASTQKYLHEKGFAHLELWPRGVETYRFRPLANRKEVLAARNISSDRFVMLYVGRLAPEKSIDVLMQTFEALPETVRERAHLIVAGDGPLLKPLTDRYNTEPNITFTGFQQGEELAGLYAAADVFVFPSATETFGNVVLEAMASGTPVIGANAGGVADNIRQGVNGLLCRAGEVKEFVEAILRIYTNSTFAEELSFAGRAYAMHQSWDAIFKRLFDSYQEVIGETPKASFSRAVMVK